jgi:hypothetical protein
MPGWRRSTEIAGWGKPPGKERRPSAGLPFPDRARRGAGAVERGWLEILWRRLRAAAQGWICRICWVQRLPAAGYEEAGVVLREWRKLG